MQDAWRAYLQVALGLTEAPRKKAQEIARKLVGQGGATAVQLQTLAEELVSTGAANRKALTKLVRLEVDKALGAVGLATAEEIAALNARVRDLERDLRQVRAGAAEAGAGGPVEAVVVAETTADLTAVSDPATPGAPTTTKRIAAKKVVAKGVGTERTVVKKTVAKKAIAKKAVPEKSVTRRTTAPTVIAKKTAGQAGAGDASLVAKSTAAKQAAAKRQPPAAGIR